VGYPTPRRARQFSSPGELPAGAGGDGLPPLRSADRSAIWWFRPRKSRAPGAS